MVCDLQTDETTSDRKRRVSRLSGETTGFPENCPQQADWKIHFISHGVTELESMQMKNVNYHLILKPS